MKNLTFVSLVVVLGTLISCSSTPVVPSADSIKISRDLPKDPDCKNLGRVQGKTISVKPDLEGAIEDMKKEAAYKGANYLVMETASGYETAVSGTAYYCP
ncbi:MAG: DUF4156 domain-containing protein [Bdellovibrionaceae bacterium]|nr:DUF4156 domain-containing protein [Pseudobdellovibrionaceae bacterium]